MPDTVTLWDGSVGPEPPRPVIEKITLLERRAACAHDVLAVSELIESLLAIAPLDAEHQPVLAEAIEHRAMLLTWLARYCNVFVLDPAPMLRQP